MKRRMWLRSISIYLLIAGPLVSATGGCNGNESKVGDSDIDADSDTDSDTDVDADSDVDTDTFEYSYSRHLAAGFYHACTIRSDSSLWCWGKNDFGQLAIDPEEHPFVGNPMRIGKDADWFAVAAGGAHVCALKSDSSLWCWGSNNFGQIGIESRADVFISEPVQIDGGETGWADVSAGEYHTCAIKGDSTLWCWGANTDGQLGREQGSLSAIPVQVGEDSDWVHVIAGGRYSCALKKDSTLWCWGNNSANQLGLGITYRHTNSLETPTSMKSDTDWVHVDAGLSHTCGIKKNFTLWCWGLNDYGNLGIGSKDSKDRPFQVGKDETWIDVAACGFHTCGIRKDSSLWCWGSNQYGQLGIGSVPKYTDTPTAVGTDNDWLDVDMGYEYTCGLKNDGTLWCWGRNKYGQLGIGSTEDQNTPTRAGNGADW